MSVFQRSVTTLALLLCVLAGVLATDASAQGIGLKTGLQRTQLRLDGETYPGVVSRSGFFGGVYWTFGQGLLAGQIEGLASRASVTRAGYDTDITSFEVPVLARVNVVRTPAARVFVTGGGAVASRWRARNVIDGVKIDIRDEIEPFDLQWIVSGGVEIRRVLVDVRYTRGVRNIDATAGDGDAKVTTERVGVSVGYGF